jgi:stage V sporulation protein SpoVS
MSVIKREHQRGPARQHIALGRTFTTQSDQGTLDLMRHPELAPRDQWYRAVEIAKVHVNHWGHAAFRRGQLAELMGVKPAVASQAVKAAIARGVVHPASTTECVIVPGHVYQDARTDLADPTAFCHEKTHEGFRDLVWFGPEGMEPAPGELDKLIAADPLTALDKIRPRLRPVAIESGGKRKRAIKPKPELRALTAAGGDCANVPICLHPECCDSGDNEDGYCNNHRPAPAARCPYHACRYDVEANGYCHHHQWMVEGAEAS